MRTILNIAACGTFAWTSLGAVGSAVADGLVKNCGSYSVDMSKAEFTLFGRNYLLTVEDYAVGKGSFNLRISPAEGLSEGRAQLQAALSSDVVCMQLDSSPIEVGVGRLDDGDWLFTTGCTGHKVRMVDKC